MKMFSLIQNFICTQPSRLEVVKRNTKKLGDTFPDIDFYVNYNSDNQNFEVIKDHYLRDVPKLSFYNNLVKDWALVTLAMVKEVQTPYVMFICEDMEVNCSKEHMENTLEEFFNKNLDNLECNINGVENIIEASKVLKSLKRVVFTSSLLVCKNGYIPKNDTDYNPPNFYGQSKMIGEKKVRSSNMHCEWVIVRPTAIWGPWFEYSYNAFFRMIDKNRYMHIGDKEFEKPASYVGNTVVLFL